MTTPAIGADEQPAPCGWREQPDELTVDSAEVCPGDDREPHVVAQQRFGERREASRILAAVHHRRAIPVEDDHPERAPQVVRRTRRPRRARDRGKRRLDRFRGMFHLWGLLRADGVCVCARVGRAQATRRRPLSCARSPHPRSSSAGCVAGAGRSSPDRIVRRVALLPQVLVPAVHALNVEGTHVNVDAAYLDSAAAGHLGVAGSAVVASYSRTTIVRSRTSPFSLVLVSISVSARSGVLQEVVPSPLRVG
jgi:hypothetical protein